MMQLQQLNAQFLNLIQLFVCLGLLSFMIIGCKAPQRITVYNYHNTFEPPNGIKIKANLYCDQTELSNASWREYQYWTARVFGKQSTKFLETKIDTAVWLKTDSCLHTLFQYYHRHPAYNNYPLVGISHKQAEQFSKWRSDRVFEYYLVNNNFIPYDSFQTADNYFTIEKYFKEELTNVVKDHRVKYYPNFRLPNLAERQVVLVYADSTNNAFLEQCKSKKCKDDLRTNLEIYANISPCPKENSFAKATRPVWFSIFRKKHKGIYNIRGNVAEWAFENNTTFGGGWQDEQVQILANDTQVCTGTNAYTGFRNVFEWKKWEE